jgi:hypothetical protein
MDELARKCRWAVRAFLLLAPINVVAQAPSAGNTNSFANIIPLPPVPTGPAPHLADGHVDLSGVWRPGENALIYDLSLGLPKGETLPLTPEGTKIKAARFAKDDPEANCLPAGVPRIAPFPWRILQTPTHIFFLFEGNIHSYRQIFMDGRPHPPDPDPSWCGHSTGRWGEDTLIIDTVGFNDVPGSITKAIPTPSASTPPNATRGPTSACSPKRSR